MRYVADEEKRGREIGAVRWLQNSFITRTALRVRLMTLDSESRRGGAWPPYDAGQQAEAAFGTALAAGQQRGR